MNTKDLRVIRTQKLLEEALLNLMAQKSYEKITIKDISSVAMVNRNTFYLHYPDKDTLLNEVVDRHLEKMRKSLPEPTVSMDVSKTVESLMAAIQNDMSFFRLMVEQDAASRFSEKYIAIMRNHVLTGLKKSYASRVEQEVNFQLLMEYTLHGAMSVILLWIRSDGKISMEDAIRFIRIISNQRISQMF